MTGLGVRASDGGSIYRPPNAERYCTLAHLDTEEQILAAAKRTVPQLVSAEQARAAAGRTGPDRRAARRGGDDAHRDHRRDGADRPGRGGQEPHDGRVRPAVDAFTGRRVIGLTTSTNAARVLAHEGLAESYNIAEFLGKIEGSDELRRPVPLHRDDVLVLDEASQLSTADLAMIGEAARQAGARIIATGDTAQLGAVEAGGMFALLASRGSRRASCTRSAGSPRSGSGRPASGSATATWPRSPPTTGTAGSAAPTPKPPTTRRDDVARRPPARQGRAAAGRVQRRSRRAVPPRPGQAHPARRRRPAAGRAWQTATTPGSATWSAPASTPRSTRAAAPSPTATP